MSSNKKRDERLVNTSFTPGEDIRLGPVAVPAEEIVHCIGYIGAPGCGKSSLIKIQCKDAARCGHSGIVLDVSDEMYHYLKKHAPKNVKVARVDGFSHRGVGIDFAKALTRQSAWVQFAHKLAPDVKNDNSPFFRAFARMVLIEGMYALHTMAPGEWMLGDLIKLCTNRELYKAVMKQVPNSQDPYGLLGKNDSARDVNGTIVSLLCDVSTFAALNDRCEKKVSPYWVLNGPNRWMVLVRNDRNSRSVEGVYSFLADMIAERALSSLNNRKLHVIADEVRVFQKLNIISEVARRGRKSNVIVTLSLHEIDGFYDRYGKEEGEEILSLLGYKLFMRVGGVNTADWGSKVLGIPEVLTDIPARGNMPANYQRMLHLRPNVIADQLRHELRLASWEEDRIEGFLDFPTVTAAFDCRYRNDVEVPPQKRRKNVAGQHERLGPMTVDDLDRLGVDINNEVLEAIGVANNAT